MKTVLSERADTQADLNLRFALTQFDGFAPGIGIGLPIYIRATSDLI